MKRKNNLPSVPFEWYNLFSLDRVIMNVMMIFVLSFILWAVNWVNTFCFLHGNRMLKLQNLPDSKSCMKFHIVLHSFLVYNSFRSGWSRSFQGRQHVKWCYVYISCFRTRISRNFFCVWMVSSRASFMIIGRMKTKKPTLLGGLLGGRCVEICLNEVMSKPSPGELLFDASAQSPPSDKTVEMFHFS